MLMEKESERERLSALSVRSIPAVRRARVIDIISILLEMCIFPGSSFISRRCIVSPNFDSILIMAPGRLDPCFIVIRLIPKDTQPASQREE